MSLFRKRKGLKRLRKAKKEDALQQELEGAAAEAIVEGSEITNNEIIPGSNDSDQGSCLCDYEVYTLRVESIRRLVGQLNGDTKLHILIPSPDDHSKD